MRTGVIVAGGRSTRFGDADKAVAELAGTPTIRRVADRLAEVVDALVVNCREDQADAIEAALSGYRHEVTFAPDPDPDEGPTAGIRTGLRAVDGEYAFVVACDMPFPSVELLGRLSAVAFGAGPGDGQRDAGDSHAGPSPPDRRPDIVIPASTGPRGVEPLFAAYGAPCIPAIEAALAGGDRRMIGFHERVAVHTIPLAEVESLCDPARAFLNVNTPEDRERAEAMAARDAGDG